MMTIMQDKYVIEFSENASRKLLGKLNKEHQIPLDQKYLEKHNEIINKLKSMGLNIF